MSIKDDVEQLCREVRSSPVRDELRHLLWELNVSELNVGKEGRCDFGYHARRQYAQFLGYLFVDQERFKIAQNSAFPIPSLADEERRLLAGAHKQITELNQRCVSTLVAAFPHCAAAIDPYNKFSLSIAQSDIGFLSEDAIMRMATSFQHHPAIAKAIETAPPELANLWHLNYMQGVWQMAESLMKAGPHETPRPLLQMRLDKNVDSKDRRAVRHLGSLTSIRDSLSNLNQLIHQAVLSDELFLLSDDNIIHLAPFTASLTGRGALVTFLPQQQINILGPNDIVKMQCSFNGNQLDLLGRIESHCGEPFPSFGEGERVDLRLLDDNLNTFGSLADV